MTDKTARPKRRLNLSRQTLRPLDPVIQSMRARAFGPSQNSNGSDGCTASDPTCIWGDGRPLIAPR